MNKKSVWIVVLVVVVVAAVWLFSRSSKPASQSDTNQNSNGQQGNQNPPPPTTSNSGSTWTGTLQNSDDATKGNLMLKVDSSATVVYMRTSRDFSALIGKNVTVSYEGTMDNFKLLDIQPK